MSLELMLVGLLPHAKRVRASPAKRVDFQWGDLMGRLLPVWLVSAVGVSTCQCGAHVPVPCDGSPAAGEVCIPGGVFGMGHDKLPMPDPTGMNFTQMPRNDWAPVHEVQLSPFFIDSQETTLGEFRACVEAGVCDVRGLQSDPYVRAAYEDPTKSDRPAHAVSFDEAVKYCRWRGKRLPTEAEWERTARGPNSTTYPWGETLPSLEIILEPTQYFPGPADGGRDVIPPAVGTTPEDVTPEGVHDLFSSVYEWASDWYDPFYYASSPRLDPPGAPGPVKVNVAHEYDHGNFIDSNGERSLRPNRYVFETGAGWDVRTRGWPMWMRGRDVPTSGIGVRCARSGRPSSESASSGLFSTYRSLRWRFEGASK